MTGQPLLFLDLHGVLVNTPKVLEEYKKVTIDHLKSDFNLDEDKAEKKYDDAMSRWEEVAFKFLRDPSKKKVGQEFVNFLENCDTLFPKYLYEDLDLDNHGNGLRTRPYEYKIAKLTGNTLYPEVENTLTRLQKHGYRMYVASSSHSSHVKGIVEANELYRYIEGIFGFDTVAATKHTIKYYKDMLDHSDAEPSLSFMIGNSMHEILKPRKLGMRTIHIDRERTVPNDVKKLADRTLQNLQSLPIHLDQIQLIV